MDHEFAKSLMPRIMALVSPEPISGCWLWSGSTMIVGYGKIRVGHSKDFSAHRISYAAKHGSIPQGMCVLHHCDVRACVNPDHLFLGTKKDNSQDMVRKGRNFSPASKKTKCPKGHDYSGKNSQGRRICKICQSEASKKYNERIKSNV